MMENTCTISKRRDGDIVIAEHGVAVRLSSGHLVEIKAKTASRVVLAGGVQPSSSGGARNQ